MPGSVVTWHSVPLPYNGFNPADVTEWSALFVLIETAKTARMRAELDQAGNDRGHSGTARRFRNQDF
jgi:hypothetical protein